MLQHGTAPALEGHEHSPMAKVSTEHAFWVRGEARGGNLAGPEGAGRACAREIGEGVATQASLRTHRISACDKHPPSSNAQAPTSWTLLKSRPKMSLEPAFWPEIEKAENVECRILFKVGLQLVIIND